MTAPTWQEILAADWAVTDGGVQDLAVYPTTDGRVVFAIRCEDGQTHRASLSQEEVDELRKTLKRAYDIAGEIVFQARHQMADMAAFDAIQRAKGIA